MKTFIKNIFKQPVATTQNPLWMVCLRCGIALISFAHFMALQPDFDNIFSAHAFVSPDIANATRDFLLPSIYSIYKSIQGIIPISYEAVLLFFRILYPLTLLFLLAGLFTRPAAILSLALHLVITNSMEYYSYGVDLFTSIALFYCCVFPIGSLFSLDVLWFKKVSPSADRISKCLKLFQTHVCIMYFFSGLEKLMGYNWRNGESIWRMLHGYNATESVNFDFLYNTPIPLLIGWATVMLELLYPLFINIQQTRKWWLAGIVIFHVSIAFFMGLYFFSSVMIILNLTAYYMPFIEENKPVLAPKSLPQLIEA
ncbi:HTTM domain-containing protein [Mucilaginibacter flavus]|uniref:HTTM domain-containing protein n=1 Tax=Mucilaginibacter flavus TaxID=931504 RepID=UPI0025B4336A|nr:HTTM domain-containing protein [Mucilaginibacter flavus]MDN3582449.1 HTTM domain-containing protein [Mucilaginibacter flavus]